MADETATAEAEQSHAEKMLAALETVLEGKATADTAAYTIAGRSITKVPIADLIAARDHYRAEAVHERRVARRKQGLGSDSKILTRF